MPKRRAEPTDPAAELRELIREAHAAIKDLRAELREARKIGEELTQSFIDQQHERLDTATVDGLNSYADSIREAIDRATQAVWDRFDLIAAIALGEETNRLVRMNPDDDPPSTAELVRRYVALHGPAPRPQP